MNSVLTWLVITLSTISNQAPQINHSSEYSGVIQMPEITITAPRYNSTTENGIVMMPDIIVKAERVAGIASNNTNDLTTTPNRTVNFLIIAINILIVAFFLAIGLYQLFTQTGKRKDRRNGKGPFSLPPFSKNKINLGKEYPCQSVA